MGPAGQRLVCTGIENHGRIAAPRTASSPGARPGPATARQHRRNTKPAQVAPPPPLQAKGQPGHDPRPRLQSWGLTPRPSATGRPSGKSKPVRQGQAGGWRDPRQPQRAGGGRLAGPGDPGRVIGRGRPGKSSQYHAWRRAWARMRQSQPVALARAGSSEFYGLFGARDRGSGAVRGKPDPAAAAPRQSPAHRARPPK